MKTPIFIDENINIYTGEQALKALNNENDSRYFEDGKGISEVSIERWQKAQVCEKNHWFAKNIKSGNDRNDYHFKQFNNYKKIKNEKFNTVLEIGCGPFTNIRFIAKVCNINKCTLLDPMVFDYLNHPYCSYNEKYLYSEYFTIIGKVIRKFFPFGFKFYQSVLSKKTRIDELFNLPGEELPKTKMYDLVIIVNVIEHCYNIEKVFQNILDITKSGSYLIFEDKLFENSEIKNSLEYSYDAAHPLKVDKILLGKFLDENFSTEYKRIQSNSNFFGGEVHKSEDMYFIGKRK